MTCTHQWARTNDSSYLFVRRLEGIHNESTLKLLMRVSGSRQGHTLTPFVLPMTATSKLVVNFNRRLHDIWDLGKVEKVSMNLCMQLFFFAVTRSRRGSSLQKFYLCHLRTMFHQNGLSSPFVNRPHP